MSEANNVREASPDIVKGSDESEFEEENSNKTTILSMVNEKLDLLLAKFDTIETSINTLKKTVDILVNKQTTIDITLYKLQKESDDKSASIINTENCCTKSLELIEERALSFEGAIQHASDQIKGQIVSSIPVGADTIQSTITDNSILTLLQEQKTTTTLASAIPAESIASENELLYSHYDFELSSSFTSKLPCDINLDSDDSFSSTPIITNRSAKRQKTDNQISTNVSTNLFPSVTTSNGLQIILTDPNTQTTFQVMKDKHDRHHVATNQELLNKETGFRHLLAYLFSTLFTEEELKVSSADDSVRGTKAFDPVRVAAIDKHLFDLYGARYAKFRISNQYKEILNKKCSRIRTKFNKSIGNN